MRFVTRALRRGGEVAEREVFLLDGSNQHGPLGALGRALDLGVEEWKSSGHAASFQAKLATAAVEGPMTAA